MATSSSTNSMEKQGSDAHAAADGGSAQLLKPPPLDGEPSDLPRVLGRYILLRRIARGGMGEVFLGSTTGLEGAERPVVVKIIRREHATDPSFIARFLDEARVQAQLQHSGVAQVIEAATDDRTGEPYAIVEHVEGRSLGDVRARALQIGHRVGWSEAVSVGTMIADALAHVHERKDPSGRPLSIVHRDLSPQNVMLSFQGEVKIIDFGTARGQNRRCRTVSGVVFAKPGYVAPEVANGDTGDARVDLYALGVMLWELCAGRRFLQGDAGAHMANVARNQCSPPPVAAACGAPVELDGIIAKLTAFDREARYGESRAVARDLAKLLSSAPVLPSGERGVRARAANLMTSLFPFEPERSRREFAKLIIAAAPLRKTMSTSPEERAAASSASPSSTAKESKRAESVEPGGDPSLLPGTRYRLLREIGRGASSVVYEAEHIDLGRRVALKVLAAEHTGVREFASRFRREARAMSRLSHEHLVKIDDFGLAADGRLFCVMELLEGETLEELLTREKSVPWEKALSIAQRALRALEVAHAASVIHRDIKPANLFLTRGGGLKLLDFGLAKAPDKGLTDAPSAAHDEKGEDLTKRPGLTILGTPEYMAPEQASSGQGDPRSDIYAVGSVMYEMLAGSLPFSGSSPVALLAAKIKAMPERPKERCPAKDIPRAADEIVMRAMARHPSLRFQSACEMRQAIEKVLDAPAASRLRRRVVGLSAIAATMAFAAVLLVGRASEIRSAAGRLLSSPTSAAEVTAAVEVQDPPAAPAPENGEPSEQPIAEGTPIEAAPVQIGPEPPLGDSSSAANAAGAAGSEPTDSDQSDEEGAAEPKAALAQAAPRKARPRQHSKSSDKAKGSSEVALAKAATSKENSGDTKAAKASADAVGAKETAKAADKPATDEKTASNAKAADPAQSAPNAEGSDAADPSDPKATDRSARKGSPAKPSRKDVPPNRRKKKTRLAKKGE